MSTMKPTVADTGMYQRTYHEHDEADGGGHGDVPALAQPRAQRLDAFLREELPQRPERTVGVVLQDRSTSYA